MLTIEYIRSSILRLRELDDDEVLSAIEDIFYDIIYADTPLYVAYIKTIPYMAPTMQDRQNFYLRLFSHREIAEAHIANHPDLNIRELSVLETLQMAKTFLLRGGHGFILNEGDKWIGVTFATYIHLFFARVVGDQDSVQQECVDLILFINTLRKNSEYRYAAHIEDGEWGGPDGACLIQVDSPDVERQEGPVYLQPIMPQSMFHVPKDAVHIVLRAKELRTSRQMVLGALGYCGYTLDLDFVPPNGFIDEPMSMDQGLAEDWHTQDLTLCFGPSEPSTVEMVVSGEECADSEPADEKSKSGLPIKNRLAPITAAGAALVHGIRDKLSRFRKEPAADEGCESEGAPNEAPPTDTQTEHPTEREPVAECPELVVATPEPVSKPKIGRPHIKRGPIILALAVLVIGCVVIGTLVSRQHRHQANMEQFCAYVDAREYGYAYSLYAKEDINADADVYLSEHLDSLVLGYANNSLGAEELSAAMGALGNFPSLQQDLAVARLTASKLESSKNAYVLGKASEDIFTRLDIWRQVLELDSVNYAAMQQDIKAQQSDYEESLNSEIEYYSTRVRSFAEARYEVLAFWYPASRYLSDWAGKYETDDSTPLNIYPVSVSSVDIRQKPNGYWYLYVDWKNTSVKTIKSICFSVIALDESGSVVTNEDTLGAWTIFDARDTNTYDPGAPASGEDYFWTGAFYGAQIADVKLTAVNIEYSDGSTASYTSDVDLSHILRA